MSASHGGKHPVNLLALSSDVGVPLEKIERLPFSCSHLCLSTLIAGLLIPPHPMNPEPQSEALSQSYRLPMN